MGVACRPRCPRPVLNEVLLTAGVAAILIAIVGGGAKAFGFDVPVLQSGRRQAALGLVGVVFLGAAVLLRDEGNGDEPDAAVQGYREEVLATCRALPRGQPAPTAGVRFEKGAYLDYLSTQRVSWQSALAELWERAAPDSLREDERAAGPRPRGSSRAGALRWRASTSNCPPASTSLPQPSLPRPPAASSPPPQPAGNGP